MQCPTDNHSLQEVTLGSVRLHACATCQGVWFEFGELYALVSQLRYQPAADILGRWQAVTGDGLTTPGELSHEGLHQCPKDKAAMQKHYYAGDSGIGIDHCLQCGGFWFAGAELAALGAYVKPDPTLDEAVQLWATDMSKQYPTFGLPVPKKPEGYDMALDAIAIAAGHAHPLVAARLLVSVIDGAVGVIAEGLGGMVA